METTINYDRQRIYAKIDLEALRGNLNYLHTLTEENVKMMAVIKTDAYGHGSIPVASEIQQLPFIEGFAVATAQEAVLLRNAGITKKILILGYVYPESYHVLIEKEVCFTVFRKDMVMEIQEAAKKLGKKALVHIAVDTGMGRIGIRPTQEKKELSDFLEALKDADSITVDGIFTHFARADETDLSHARKQLETFTDFVDEVQKFLDIVIPWCHASNSAGIMTLKEANLDMVRVGITMYGIEPSNAVYVDRNYLKPVMSLHSHIVYLKDMYPGETISYGGTFKVEKKMKVATITAGYGDGYPRALSGKGYVLVEGKRANILGRVCMDQMMIDVTDIPDVREGMEVVLMGQSGDSLLSAEMLGDMSGRFPYELVCDINPRVPRIYCGLL